LRRYRAGVTDNTCDDRSIASGRLRFPNAGSDINLSLHNPNLARRTGCRAFAWVISAFSGGRQMTLVIKKSEEGWLIFKVRKTTRTLLDISPLKTLEEARAIAVFGLLACAEVTQIRYED
jgi:hypothetical protein